MPHRPLAQAWAVLSAPGQLARAVQAMASAQQHLCDDGVRLMRLLDPSLQNAVPGACYIQAYPPCVCEKGDQDNHGAVWALMATARLQQPTEVWHVFTALNAAHRSAEPARAAVYAAEPYEMAGDIQSQAQWAGRAGWSWYTGSDRLAVARGGRVDLRCGAGRRHGDRHALPATALGRNDGASAAKAWPWPARRAVHPTRFSSCRPDSSADSPAAQAPDGASGWCCSWHARASTNCRSPAASSCA